MTESATMRRIQIALSRETRATSFRNHVGSGWHGKLVSHRDGRAVIEGARPLHAGLCDGSADLIGWAEVLITPDMVGRKVAVFTALEVKSPAGRPTDEQRNFLQRVKTAGGIGEVVRSEDQAVAAVRLYRGAK